MEIEKKFLVKSLPEKLEKYESHEIEQGYLCGNPVVRVRKRDEDYILTYKSKLGVKKEQGVCACKEIEVPLTEESYYHLLQKADGIIISKKRVLIPYNDHIIELDIFHGDYEGLIVAEVEFESLEQAECFQKPSWFGCNVSDDSRYSNRRMSESIINFQEKNL